MATEFQASLECAAELDAKDGLASFRNDFEFPKTAGGDPFLYFCGNSLGLLPTAARDVVNQELEDWGNLAVEAHFRGKTPWYKYHEVFHENLGELVGGSPREIVVMNSLTVNLHLLMVSFYRPTATRYKIMVESPTFPSDLYAMKTQMRYHGIDPKEALIEVSPRPGEVTLREEDVLKLIHETGDSLALLMFGGINFFTGQWFPFRAFADAAHDVGAYAGFDCAHAAGNVPLDLHANDADFAVWCSYKYLNAGPGATSGAFIHERHATDVSLPRYGGWWGNDPDVRFRMHLEPEFKPVASADAWQLSNPSILAMAPLQASLDLFHRAGMPALRQKSESLTGFLEYLIDSRLSQKLEVLTPRTPSARGCQLSLKLKNDAQGLQKKLQESGVICDFREPDVLRIAPTPLYNSYTDVFQFVQKLEALLP